MAPKGKAGGKKSGDEPLKVANSLQLRHILCEKQSKLLVARERLQNGESFTAVATEMSEDKARHGGSLGWMVRAAMNGEFQSRCFDIPISTPQKPIYEEIKTKHGYHLVMVEGRK